MAMFISDYVTSIYLLCYQLEMNKFAIQLRIIHPAAMFDGVPQHFVCVFDLVRTRKERVMFVNK